MSVTDQTTAITSTTCGEIRPEPLRPGLIRRRRRVFLRLKRTVRLSVLRPHRPRSCFTNADPNLNGSERGASVPELLVVVLIVGIATTLALMSVRGARSSFEFSNTVLTLKGYLERAVSDAKKRNAKGGERAVVQVTGIRSYNVTIDFNGDGVPETRTVALPSQAMFVYDPASPPTATLDGRGYVAESDVTFRLRSEAGQTSDLRLTSNGDASIDTTFPSMPSTTSTPTSLDVKNTAVLAGNNAPNTYASPTPTPTPLPFCSGSQLPATNNCRCSPNKTISSDGKCK